MIFELIKPGTLENVIIKTQHNCLSDHRSYSGRFISIVHEYVLLLRKDQLLLYPLLMTRRLEGDIRDMPGAAWRDILADAMASFHDPVALDRIYEKVEHYKRARIQNHWLEKARQTLQYHPNIFYAPKRGMWALKKTA